MPRTTSLINSVVCKGNPFVYDPCHDVGGLDPAVAPVFETNCVYYMRESTNNSPQASRFPVKCLELRPPICVIRRYNALKNYAYVIGVDVPFYCFLF